MFNEGLGDEDYEIDRVTPWPHQASGFDSILNQLAEDTRRILFTSPTGGGKTWVMVKAGLVGARELGGCALFANRKLLIDQMCRSMTGYGLRFGVRAAGHGLTDAPFQVCSIQTEYSRLVKRKTWTPHPCGLFIVDEAHLNENPQAQAVYDEYTARGAVKLGFTATPLGLDGKYDVLIQAGTTSELRACGALVEAVHHGCTEPDVKHIRRYNVGEDLTEPDNVKAIMVPGIHGRVIDHYRRLNPHGLPAIGFAPGVPESVGFAQAFEEAGIPAAHIDGDVIWIRGREVRSTQETRDELLRMSRAGEVRIVWNRFVLREAVDMPWLRHGILATVFGSLQSYVQSGGRLLRACPSVGKRHVCVQDHGGNWWRHGSLNADRYWRLTDTDNLLGNERLDAVAGDTETPPKEPEPFLCPRCAAVMQLRRPDPGSRCRCPRCGYEFDFRRRSRPVLQRDGELVEYPGPALRPKRVERRADTASLWKNVYWRAKNSKSMTFSQAAGLFCHEHGYFPPRTLPLMPVVGTDWYLPVAKVPFPRLHPEG